MVIQSRIQQKLENAFSPSHIEVINESDNHNVPAGSESHFKVVLVSKLFEGRRLVARHQAIYAELQDELNGEVHALALHVYTDDEWLLRSESAPLSPACRGGEK